MRRRMARTISYTDSGLVLAVSHSSLTPSRTGAESFAAVHSYTVYMYGVGNSFVVLSLMFSKKLNCTMLRVLQFTDLEKKRKYKRE